MPIEDYTSPAAVHAIADLADPVQRNLKITRSYHELSLALSARLGPNANWCTFATWASRQAGRTIRREDLHRALDSQLRGIPELTEAVSGIAELAVQKGAQLGRAGIAKLLWELVNPEAALQRASDAVARGNQKVYAEIGRAFAAFLVELPSDSPYDAARLEPFITALRSGNPPDGQQYLRQAFSRYYQAGFEPDRKKKAELLLLANLEIGFHEQTRLQPEIAEALEAAVEDPQLFKEQLLDTLFPGKRWLRYLGALWAFLTGRPTPLDAALTAFAELARRKIRLFMTRHLMTLGFPDALDLRLGRDLEGRFPDSLRVLENPDLTALLQRIDPTRDSLLDTGTVDWADLADRLHFIADMFRCYQETAELLALPEGD